MLRMSSIHTWVAADALTPLDGLRAWTEQALRRSSALLTGAITRIAVTEAHSNTSKIYHLSIEYTADATGMRPLKLFLKVCSGSNIAGSFDDSEVRYYTHDYRDAPDAPLPRCYDGQFDSGSGTTCCWRTSPTRTSLVSKVSAPMRSHALGRTMQTRWQQPSRLCTRPAGVASA